MTTGLAHGSMARGCKTLSTPARTRAVLSHPTEWATRPRSPEPHGVECPAPDSNRRCPSNSRTGLQLKIGCAGGSLTDKDSKPSPRHRSRRVTTEGNRLRRAALTHPTGAASGIRTRDLPLTRRLLYHLSYHGGMGSECIARIPSPPFPSGAIGRRGAHPPVADLRPFGYEGGLTVGAVNPRPRLRRFTGQMNLR